jgi:hypothetical protein
MRIALKYGLLITLAIILWVVMAHALVPNPDSKIHSLGAMLFFNLAEILGVYFGIKAVRSAGGSEIEFKKGVKTGVSIAFVYAISSCLFFLIELLVLGPKILAGEAGTQTKPMWQVALGAFAGLFIFAILLGVIYSTLISFLLTLRAKRQGV